LLYIKKSNNNNKLKVTPSMRPRKKIILCIPLLQSRDKPLGYLARLLPVNQYVSQIPNSKEQEQRIHSLVTSAD